MRPGDLGRWYKDGTVIVREGDEGHCAYVVQEGTADVLQEGPDGEVRLATLGAGDLFGEMALVEKEVRSATVRAVGDVRMLAIDRRTFLSRIHQDPSLAVHVVQTMSKRIRDLDERVSRRSAGH